MQAGLERIVMSILQRWTVVVGILSIGLAVTHSLITSLNLLPALSVSSALTSLLAGAGLILLLAMTATRARGEVIFLWPWFLLLLVSGVSLAFTPSLPGAQNFLSLMAFIGIMVTAISVRGLSSQRINQALEYFVYSSAALSLPIVLLYLSFGGKLPDERSFAMAFLVPLVVGAAKGIDSYVFALCSWLVWVAIATTGSRTATAIGLLILAGIHLIDARLGWGARFIRAFLSAFLGLGAYVILILGAPRVRGFWAAGDAAISVPVLAPVAGGEIVVNSSGRVDAWKLVLSELQSAEDWIFGKGTGVASVLLRSKTEIWEQTLNEYIRYLVDNGLIGVALFVLGIVACLLRVMTMPPSVTPWKGIGFGAIIALAFLSLTEPPILYVFSATPIALCLGLAMNQSLRLESEASTGTKSVIQTHLPRWFRKNPIQYAQRKS